MLKRLVHAAASCGKQLLHTPAAGAVSTPAAATAVISHVPVNGASLWQQAAAGRALWRQLQHDCQLQQQRAFSTTKAAANKSHQVLESVVEQQKKKLLMEAGKAGAAAGPQAPPSVVARIFGVVVDSVALGLGGLLLFGGYYSLAYRSSSELEDMLKDAKESVRLAEISAAPPAGEGSPGSAPPPPPPLPAAASRSGPPVEPAKVPPVTKAWCTVMERYLKLRQYVEKSIKDYQDPTYHKLLPDMAPELRGRIKTLVLDLDDVLVHKEWTRQSGWKIYKRPGVQDFLLEMAGYYELVIFTDATATYAEPIINKLDPHRAVMYRLYRPETQYHNGKHVRDLSKLNRDLSQVLMISADPDAWEFQPENTIKLQPWVKDTTDTTLLDLIPMLQLIATKGVRDVRDVVKSYDDEKDVAKAFKARMAQISEHQKQQQKRSLLGFK